MNKKLLAVLTQVIILIFVSCNIDIEIPTQKELKIKSTLENEVNNVLFQNQELFAEEYSIFPNATLNYIDGERTETHAITFSCYNENLNNLETSKVDSVSSILAKVILDNIENDTSFSQIVIAMTKQEKSAFIEKEWNYSKGFEIEELKNNTLSE